MPKRIIDSGDQFKDWTVISETDPVQYGSVKIRHFVCRCKCGHEQTVAMTNLSTGASGRCWACRETSKMDRNTALAILNRLKRRDMTMQQIADRYGVTRNVIDHLKRGNIWPELTRPS